MAASPPCCFRLEATRGPHSGVVLRQCQVNAAAVSSSPACALSIGRKKRCWLRLPKDLEVSSVHAEFRFVEGGTGVAIRDAKSTNGTKLNGKPLVPHQDYPLSNEDLIAVGRTSLRYVKVLHGQPCGEEAENSVTTTATASANDVLSSSVSSPVAAATRVIVLDEDLAESTEVKDAPLGPASASGIASGDTPVDQPDTEPAHDELILEPAMTVSVSAGKSNKGAGSNVELSLATKPLSAMGSESRGGAIIECTPEEATCTLCKAVIGKLDLLEQQTHFNVCLGGRVAAASGATVTKGAKPKARKRGNTGDAACRSKKPRKPKAGEDCNDVATTAPKARKARKRKRAPDAGESIELALALTGKSKMSKEEQTDMQLAVTKKKLEQLDVQITKLAKRRVNLVKTLGRLERTKEKFRKSQVLPPAKVLQLLDLKAAFDVIFPSNRQIHSVDRRESKELPTHNSTVAKQYAPCRLSERGIPIECDEEKRAELAAVAAISMWARASQQLFGLERDMLLYRNSVLRAFLGDGEDADDSAMNIDNVDDVNDVDEDGGFEQEDESEEKVEPKPIPPDENSDPDAEAPDVVKRVFLNWRRDLAFLRDQTAEEIEMALEAMKETQAQADAAASAESESDQREGSCTEIREEHNAANPGIASSKNELLAREEQRLACEYMAQVMIQLIAEKRQRDDVVKLAPAPSQGSQQQYQPVINLVDSSGEEVGQQEQASDIVVARDNKAEEEPYSSFLDELPKGGPGRGLTALEGVKGSDTQRNKENLSPKE